MVDALEAFGIRVEAAHHEVAAGQHEIDFEYSDALRTADNAITFKYTLKAIAQQHGLYATFMPKPIHGINGSGMHTHQSLYSIAEDRNAFADANNKYGLSDLARSYMAGILAHARGMIAVLAPTVNSYKRLVPGYEAPTYLTWGRTNRSALIRVPMVSPGRSIEGTRVEVRCPDPSSNTYLAFAAMIAAGLDGVERGLELADPVEECLFEMDCGADRGEGHQGAAGHARRGDRGAREGLGHPRGPRRPRLRPLRRGQAGRVGRVPHAGLGLGGRPLPRHVLAPRSAAAAVGRVAVPRRVGAAPAARGRAIECRSGEPLRGRRIFLFRLPAVARRRCGACGPVIGHSISSREIGARGPVAPRSDAGFRPARPSSRSDHRLLALLRLVSGSADPGNGPCMPRVNAVADVWSVGTRHLWS